MPDRSVSIANEFLRLSAGSGLTQMHLQKLVYFAHGWNLAINDNVLATDPVKAWPYGPVFPDLYDHTKYFGSKPIVRALTPDDDQASLFFLDPKFERSAPYVATLTPVENEVVSSVWRKYGRLSAFKMSDLTHRSGTPWTVTYREKGKNAVIDQNLIKDHFLELARQPS